MKWLLFITVSFLFLYFITLQDLKLNDTDSPPPSNLQSSADVEASVIQSTPNRSVIIESVDKPWLIPQLRYDLERFLESDSGNLEDIKDSFLKKCQTLDYCDKLTDLFERYIEFSLALNQQHLNFDPSELERLYQLKNELIQQYFSEDEISALFIKEMNWHQQMLERRNILTNNTITPVEKQELLQAHFDNLPEDQKLDIKNTLALEQVMNFYQSNNIQGQNNSDLAINLPKDTLQRIQEKSELQESWKQRVKSYLDYLNTIKKNT
jgi:lipase chaperone LimK